MGEWLEPARPATYLAKAGLALFLQLLKGFALLPLLLVCQSDPLVSFCIQAPSCPAPFDMRLFQLLRSFCMGIERRCDQGRGLPSTRRRPRAEGEGA